MIKKKKNKIINGKRIYLRELRVSDATKSYCKWLNDPKVNRYLESRFEKWTTKKLRAYIRNIRSEGNNFFWAIILKENNKHIGNVKLGPINPKHRFSDIGIIIGEKSCWGRGLAVEAIKLVKNYAFHILKINKLTAGAYVTNIGSIKAFQKSGFHIEGIRRRYYRYRDKYIDAVILGINKK
jgi:ribosomal-protein-alanine N-acetyltransferase